MINRTMVRTRVLQTLFAYYTDGEKTPFQAQKELVKSFADTYNLYAMLLALADELTTYAKKQITEQEQRAKATHSVFTPNRRFADNTFATQIFQNKAIRHLMQDSHLSWDACLSVMPALYKKLQDQYYYQLFMDKEAPTYEDEKELWKKIYSLLLPDNPDLTNALEELELCLDQQNWETDLNVVLSYVVKTVKRFKQENGATQPLLAMFDSEDELQFAQDLLTESIAHTDEWSSVIERHLKNWDMARVAFMDRVILIIALTEINCFPEIAAQVSLNEYIELAKEYSSDKSYIFINGILDEIIKEQQTFKI